MNKIGRRKIERRVVYLPTSRAFMREAAAPALLEARIDQMMSERRTFGRWLAWLPAGERTVRFSDSGDLFIRNAVEVMARQPWVFRFVGRRRR